ncbi:MAG: hypothetical protein ACI97A_002675 [Planctomycetota bacterium]|jgi:hypothetical protein
MSPVLLKFLIRRHRFSCLLLGILPLFIGIVIGFLYPTYSKERGLLKVLKYSTRFFGGEQLDIFSPDGAFSMPFQHPLVMIGYAVLPAIAALGIPAGDRGNKGLDLILATPLSRGVLCRTVWFFQVLASIYMTFMALSAANISALMSDEFAGINHLGFFAIALVSFSLMSAFGAFSMIISVLARDRGQASLIYGISVTVFFLTDVTARMWKDGAWLTWLTPYGYLRPARVLSAEAPFSSDMIRDLAILLTVGIAGQFYAAHLHRKRRSA